MTSPPASPDPASPTRLFTFRSGGWVLLVTGALAVVIIVMTLAPAIQRFRARPPGDGRDPATFGFDLSTCLVPQNVLVAGQLHRDLMPPLVDPPTMRGDAVLAYNGEIRGKYLVPNDRVIGVTINGVARAYPILILKLHEVVNDRLGDTPIAVTYNPLCDSVVVFDRVAGDEVLEFGVSGLLYNSNLLLYDRRPEPGRESLWSQLQARAVAGPAAAGGRTLRVLPAELTHWSDWLARHPETTVLAPDARLLKRYKETVYTAYDSSDELLFPVDPSPSAGGLRTKARCVVVTAGDDRRLYPLSVIAGQAEADGTWTDTLGGVPLRFRVFEDPEAVTVTTGSAESPVPASVVPGFWFSWYAMDPGIDVAR